MNNVDVPGLLEKIYSLHYDIVRMMKKSDDFLTVPPLFWRGAGGSNCSAPFFLSKKPGEDRSDPPRIIYVCIVFGLFEEHAQAVVQMRQPAVVGMRASLELDPAVVYAIGKPLGHVSKHF